MRNLALIAALALAACAAPSVGPQTSTPLAAADAATTLIAGERLDLIARTPGGEAEGQDPLVLMTLRHSDGRAMNFEEANHAPTDLMAQAPGGPLAQIMGLFGEEAPTLYSARPGENQGAPFICGPEGPTNVGLYQAPDGNVHMVGLKQPIRFEDRPDGTQEALPYSPDMVCARLRFRRS